MSLDPTRRAQTSPREYLWSRRTQNPSRFFRRVEGKATFGQAKGLVGGDDRLVKMVGKTVR